MKNLWLKIAAPWRWAIVLFLVVMLPLGLWYYGARAVNGISRAVFRGRNAVVTKEMQKDLDDAHKWRDAATQTIQELATAKQKLTEAKTNYESEKQKLSLAETVLADKSKNTDAKLKAYDEAVRSAPTVHVPGESIDALCERAKARGLELAICQP